MSEPSKALDEVLDELANKYQGPDYVAAKEGAERMYERWNANE